MNANFVGALYRDLPAKGPVYRPAPGTDAALDLARAWGRA